MSIKEWLKGCRLIKDRIGRASARGIYIQDPELRDTAFRPGTKFIYEVDLDQKLVVIRVASECDNATNRVSTHRFPNAVKPVIDIRSRKALGALEGARRFQFLIYDETIVVRGLVEDGHNTTVSGSEIAEAGQSQKRTARVVDLQVRRNQYLVVEVLLRRRDVRRLARAAGLDQLRFDFESLEGSSPFTWWHALRDLPEVLTAVSLFSGAGVFDLGFIQSGVEVVFALDADPWAVETYRRNIGDHVVLADIREYPKDLIPKAPVLFGGSPCQDFSNANRSTRGRLLESPKNRLVLEFIEAVKAVQPQVFVFENVPQVLTAGDGMFAAEFLQRLGDYDISCGVLDAADYGDPQHRKRAIFIGSRVGRIELPNPTHGPKGHKPYVTVRDAIGRVMEHLPNARDYTAPRPETAKRMAMIRPGENWRALPPELRGSEKHHSNYLLRLDPDQPSCALPNWRKALILHPWENRILSVREAAALCSIPDNFEFHGPLDAKQQQVGNCVPVNLSRAVARAVAERLSQRLAPALAPVGV